jgi:hypothetical protein
MINSGMAPALSADKEASFLRMMKGYQVMSEYVKSVGGNAMDGACFPVVIMNRKGLAWKE